MSTGPIDEELEDLKDGSWRQWAAIDEALERGDIDEAGWYRATADVLVPSYLAGKTPRAQSGHSGDERRWEGARRLLLDGVEHGGSLLDVGCANGHLMESLHRWAAEDGLAIEPWGLEISPELAALARERLPHWRDRIAVGNAIDWASDQRFDVVRTGLEYVPSRRRPLLVEHLLGNVVAPGGRLIVGVFTEEAGAAAQQATVASWGYTIAGSAERPHPDTRALVRRAFWIDAE